jgi:hypothetical protein
MNLAEVDANLLPLFFKHGFRFHPSYIGSDKKLHALHSWPERAASNQEELIALIQEAGQKGDVSRLGVVPPEHYMIVDLDVRDGKNGLRNFADLCEKHQISATPVIQVKSKSGGLHLYFKTLSKRVKTVSNVAKFDGVDIRGQGGFVYAPVRAGELSTWQEGEYLLFDMADDFAHAIPFDDRKLFLEHTLADEKKYLAEAIRTRTQTLTRLPKGGRDESLHFCVHEMYRSGYKEDEAHSFLDWLITICDQDDDIESIKEKFHATIEQLFTDEKRLVTGAVVDLDSVVRALRNADIYSLRAEQKNAISYMAIYENSFKMTPYQAYGREVFADILNMFTVADVDGKIKSASKVILPRAAAILPSVDRRGFVPRTDVTVFKEPETNAECINVYRAPFSEAEALELAPRADGDIWNQFCAFLEHLFADKASHALEMIAWMVHRPDRKMISAPIFVSEVQGVGKDTLIGIIASLIGHQYIQRVDQASQLIDSKINVSRSLLLYIKELQLGKGIAARNEVEKLGSRLKTMITESVQRCEEKFQQPFEARSFCNLIIASNRNTVAQLIEPSDRRYNIFDCAPDKSLDHFPKFDKMAELARNRDPANVAALWLRLRNVKAEFVFDKDTAPNDNHKSRLMSREYESCDQFLLDNLPDAFTQHLAAYLLVKGKMAEPRDAFMRAEYFIRNMLRREISPVKSLSSAGSSNWQFTQCRAFQAENGVAIWKKGQFKPARPYLYVRLNSPSFTQLVHGTQAMFWKSVEDLYDEVLHAGDMATLNEDDKMSREHMNIAMHVFLNTTNYDQARASVKSNINATGSNVH